MGNFIRVQEALLAWFLVQVQVSYCLYDLLCHLSQQHFRYPPMPRVEFFTFFKKCIWIGNETCLTIHLEMADNRIMI